MSNYLAIPHLSNWNIGRADFQLDSPAHGLFGGEMDFRKVGVSFDRGCDQVYFFCDIISNQNKFSVSTVILAADRPFGSSEDPSIIWNSTRIYCDVVKVEQCYRWNHVIYAAALDDIFFDIKYCALEPRLDWH